MAIKLSLLDKSPIPEGHSAADALRQTIALARAADDLGYHRFWLAEHHGSAALASAAPEVMIAQILTLTQHIRVGSGGVLLQHYSAFKVAEVFGVLASLAPGRVDLGIGKSPGGLPNATRALQSELAAGSARAFDRKLAELDAYLTGDEIHPRSAILPERFLLGASIGSAEQAARLGWGFVHAGHQDGDEGTTRRSLGAYQAIAGHLPALAVAAFAAPTRAEAEDRVAGLRIVKIHLPDGHAVNLPSVEAAAEYARQYGTTEYRTEEKHPTVITGTAADVRDALEGLHQILGVQEFILDMPVADPAARLKSIQLLAGIPRRAAA